MAFRMDCSYVTLVNDGACLMLSGTLFQALEGRGRSVMHTFIHSLPRMVV